MFRQWSNMSILCRGYDVAKRGKGIIQLVLSISLSAIVSSPSIPFALAQQAQPTQAEAGFDPALLLHEKTIVPPAADFVRASRPDENKLNYIPFGSQRPEPKSKVMTPDQVKAVELQLDQLRLKQDQLSGRHSAPLVTKSVTGQELRPQKSSSAPAKAAN